MDRKTRELLINLESENAKERYLAVVELGKKQDTSLIPHLNKVATLDANPKVRQVAYQAVKFLTKMKEEQIKASRQARQAALDALDDAADADDSNNWGDMDDIFEDDDDSSEDRRKHDSGSWDYRAAVKAQQEAKKKAEIEKLTNQQASKRRRRRPYRIFLWLCVAISLMLLAFAAQQVIKQRDEPDSREEAIQRLDEWLDDVEGAVALYGVALNVPEFVCSDLDTDALNIPTRPVGLGPDAAHQEDLDSFFDHLQSIENTLTETRTEMERVCSTVPGEEAARRFTLPPDWGPKRRIESLPAEHIQPARIQLEAEREELATPTPAAEEQ